MKLALVVLIASLSAASAFAEGTLGYSMKFREGFWRVDVVEKESVREGVMSLMGSRYYLTSYIQDNRLYMPFAQYNNDSLEVKVYDEKQTWYRGFMWGNIITNIDTYKDLKKGTMRMIGTIGDDIDFVYQTNISKKGMRSADLRWIDRADRDPVEMLLEISFSDKDDGACTGRLRASFEEVAKFACKSSGKLKDAFFNYDTDVIAWLVHLLIQPSNN